MLLTGRPFSHIRLLEFCFLCKNKFGIYVCSFLALRFLTFDCIVIIVIVHCVDKKVKPYAGWKAGEVNDLVREKTNNLGSDQI